MPEYPAFSQDVTLQLEKLGFLTPSFTGKSLSTVVPAIASALGLHESFDVHDQIIAGGSARAKAAQQDWHLASASSVCLIVIDGLGYSNLSEYRQYAPFLWAAQSTNEAARSAFPSTTATSMGVIGTGSVPGRTGMIGYSALNPETGAVGNFVSWNGISQPRTIQREPVLFEHLSQQTRVTSIGLARFDGSGMTEAALRGATYKVASDLRATFDRALHEVKQPGLTHVYWNEVDKVGHIDGVGSPSWCAALSALDQEAERFIEKLPAGVSVVLTADHGMLNVDFSARADVARNYSLAKGMRAFGGEPRCAHVYFNSPGTANKALTAWASELSDTALVLRRFEAIEMGLFGPVSEHVTQWIGDLVVIMAGNATVVDSDSMSPMALRLKGVHGSLTPTEVLVPSIVWDSTAA